MNKYCQFCKVDITVKNWNWHLQSQRHNLNINNTIIPGLSPLANELNSKNIIDDRSSKVCTFSLAED
jgi:hypothetical protein